LFKYRDTFPVQAGYAIFQFHHHFDPEPERLDPMTTPTRHFILGAAGHVDHGKTALITALTGTNTDRLKEERDRGISIELGFAELDLGGGIQLGVVDMPGHERFVKQMVSGAGGVDLAFLVIAADEGVMPQTIEHLGILDSLGVRSGVVVVSKTDMVDEDFTAVVTEEARELVVGTFLEGKPVVAVSAIKGTGLEELKSALRAEAEALPVRAELGAFRLPVDRVFTLPGAGVIVTGTCWSGSVGVGDRLQAEPGAMPVRVREVQVHGRRAERGASGQRLALALHGVKKEDLQRGHQIIAPGGATVTRRLDIRVNLMSHYRGGVRNRQRLHVHHAGREVLGRIVLIDEPQLGEETGPRTGLGQLHLEDELTCARGDRLVLRFYSPVVSIAGGVILDPVPRPHKRFDAQVIEALGIMENGDPEALFRQRLQQAGLAGLALGDALGMRDDPEALPVGNRLYHRALAEDLSRRLAGLVADYASRYPLRMGVPKEEARRKCRFKGGPNEWNALCASLEPGAPWVVVGDRIGPSPDGPSLSPGQQKALAHAVEDLQSCGLEWPGLEGWAEQSVALRGAATDPALKDFTPAEVTRWLVDHGHAVAVSNEYIVPIDARERLIGQLREYFANNEELSFKEFRELSGLSRKLGIPLLEHLDQAGLTVRRQDVRVAGPALESS